MGLWLYPGIETRLWPPRGRIAGEKNGHQPGFFRWDGLERVLEAKSQVAAFNVATRTIVTELSEVFIFKPR
jgi:hypothetical protein